MKVFIACSASSSIEQRYYDEMQKVCKMLCKNNFDLVFSPCDRGMLSICYNTFKNNSRGLYGYTIEQYKSSLETMPDVDCKIEESSFDRLKAFYNESDILLFMPGGSGTLGELFGIIEEGKNNLQNKKIVLYNFNNFFEGLFNFIKECQGKNFISERDLQNLTIVNNFAELEKICKN